MTSSLKPPSLPIICPARSSSFEFQHYPDHYMYIPDQSVCWVTYLFIASQWRKVFTLKNIISLSCFCVLNFETRFIANTLISLSSPHLSKVRPKMLMSPKHCSFNNNHYTCVPQQSDIKTPRGLHYLLNTNVYTFEVISGDRCLHLISISLF